MSHFLPSCIHLCSVSPCVLLEYTPMPLQPWSAHPKDPNIRKSDGWGQDQSPFICILLAWGSRGPVWNHLGDRDLTAKCGYGHLWGAVNSSSRAEYQKQVLFLEAAYLHCASNTTIDFGVGVCLCMPVGSEQSKCSILIILQDQEILHLLSQCFLHQLHLQRTPSIDFHVTRGIGSPSDLVKQGGSLPLHIPLLSIGELTCRTCQIFWRCILC